MNLFVVFRQADGTLELVTPPLDGMILPGVIRDSVLNLARSHSAGSITIPELSDKLVVTERSVTMKEVKEAAQEGRLVELFGTGMTKSSSPHLRIRTQPDAWYIGTAAVISPVDRIGYEGQDVHIPTEADGMGPVSRPIWRQLTGIQMGTIPSEWSITVTE